jgi:hypothetical protein
LLQSLLAVGDTKIEKYKEKLKAALDAEGITYTNRFYYLGYNPPFEVLTVEMKLLSSCKVCLLIQLQNNKFEFHKKMKDFIVTSFLLLSLVSVTNAQNNLQYQLFNNDGNCEL